jgi:hypothetical protein
MNRIFHYSQRFPGLWFLRNFGGKFLVLSLIRVTVLNVDQNYFVCFVISYIFYGIVLDFFIWLFCCPNFFHIVEAEQFLTLVLSLIFPLNTTCPDFNEFLTDFLGTSPVNFIQ